MTRAPQCSRLGSRLGFRMVGLLASLPLLAACPTPPPLQGGPPPEFEPPRAFALPGAPSPESPESPAPPSGAPGPATSTTTPAAAPPPTASAAASASPGPSTWTSTSTEPATVAPGVGDPIPPDGRVGAKHLLVMYQGARLAPPSVTRSKDEARKRAEACLVKAKAPGAKFEDVVTECTDEPHGAKRGGDLFTFKPGVMAPEFSKGVLDTKVGQLSPVVETAFGFHVILRTR